MVTEVRPFRLCPPTSSSRHLPKPRKPGTGGIYQLNDHLWEGKYSPRDAHGKRISRNVYAKTREECEAKLAVLIDEMKSEIAAEKTSDNLVQPKLHQEHQIFLKSYQ